MCFNFFNRSQPYKKDIGRFFNHIQKILVLHRMKKFIIIFLFLPVIVFSQERITLTGNVFDGITFFPIEEANIYNFNSKKYSFTNKDGNFEVLVRKGDTIIISKPIYKQALIEITQEIIEQKSLEVPLYFKAILLKEVHVYTLPATYDMFKKEFVNVAFSDFYKVLEGTALSKEERMSLSSGLNVLDAIPGKVGQAIRSPISALYDRFSRKMKMERLHQELVDNEEEVARLPLKYNRDLVSSLTELQGDELLNFMTFCRFSYYDLVRWSPEFIISQIKRKFDDYQYYKALQDY